MGQNKQREIIHEVSVEIKAYINQQIARLAPFCLPDSGVTISIEREYELDGASNEIYYVLVKLTGEGAEVESVGKADDIIEATRNAIQSLVDHLQRVQLQMMADFEDRENSDANETNDTEDGGSGKAYFH